MFHTLLGLRVLWGVDVSISHDTTGVVTGLPEGEDC